MYLLPKLIALQLLLLCVATKAEDKWWSFTAKGGFFYGPNKYAADENTTVEFVTTYVGDDNTILEWTTTDSKIELNQAVTRKHLGQYSGWLYLPYIITTTLSFTTHGKERPEYHITHDKYSKINNAIIQNHIIEKFMVQYVDGPEISLVGENVEMVDDNGVYSFMENEQFSLNCYAGGLANTTIEWVDQYGKTVIPSQVTELGLLTEMRDTDNGHFQTWQILNVTAKKEMTSFGCRMKAPNYKSSPFEDTNYFEFTVVSKDTVNSNCDPITFDCQNEVVGVKRSLKFS